MDGYMTVKKTKIEQKSQGLVDAFNPMNINLNPMNLNLNAVTNIVPLGFNQQKKYMCIRNGVLYQFERKTARQFADRFKLGNVTSLDLKTEENGTSTIRMLYKKYLVNLTIDNKVVA